MERVGLFERIDEAIEKSKSEAFRTGKRGSETVNVDLEITEEERNLFLNSSKCDTPNYSWTFDYTENKIMLGITYVENVGDIMFYDGHNVEVEVVPYGQYKNLLAAKGYKPIKDTYDEDSKTIAVEHKIPRKWIVTIEDEEYTVYSTQKYITSNTYVPIEVEHKQKIQHLFSGDWLTFIYVDTKDEKIIEDCKYAFVEKDNFNKKYVEDMCKAYPEFGTYFDIKYIGEEKDVDLSKLQCVVECVKREGYGDNWYLV